MANQNDKRTASQRIDDLERAIMSIFQVTNNMTRDLTLIKDALKLLGNKADSIAKVSLAGLPLNDENISAQMKQNQLDELKAKVQNLIDQKVLVPGSVIGDTSFVIGSENEPDAEDGTPGKIVNSRLQFTLASLDKAVQDKLKGAKVGDTVTFQGDALVFKVNEVYEIVNPNPPAPATEEEAEGGPAPALEASAAPAEAASAPAEEQAPAAPVPASDSSVSAAPEAPQSSSDAAQAAPAAPQDPAAGN